jgi:hypothetical protein
MKSLSAQALGSFFVSVLCWGAGSSVAWTQTLDQDGLFSGDTLQEIRLAVSPTDWQTLKANADENTYFPADLTWKGVTVRNVGIRSRGGSTRSDIKPGLKIDINRYVPNQDFLGLKSLILDNAYTDSTILRESVTMKLFTRMGVVAPREAHARLYVNNEYVGAYVMVESVDRTFISRVFGAEEGEAKTGGYLFEYKYEFPYYLEYLGPDLRPYAEIFKPQTRGTESIVNMYGPIEAMIRAINESTDEDFTAAVGKYLDLRLFMKYLAVESFMVEWDGFVGEWAANNFYLYRFRHGGRSQLIPWDKDHAFEFVDTPITYRFESNVLVRRALLVPELRQAYLDALMQCVRLAEEADANDPRGWLEREVDRQAGHIALAVAQDPVFPFSFDQFQDDVGFLLRFARTRPEFVRCQVSLEGSPDEPSDCAIAVAAANSAFERLP